MATNDEDRRAKIAELNDQVRKDAGLPTSHFQATNPHRVLITAGVAALPLEDQIAICRKVREFNAFDDDNDPHGEHDFGIVKHGGSSVYWKIDLYEAPSVKAADEVPVVTRVLTILFATEY
jgi:Protein of unknown function (DUF3768)